METISKSKQTHNEHEYIDLGLPSGIKWAACNVGAATPYEAGDFYAWGEKRLKKIYDCETYFFDEKKMRDISGFTKYDVVSSSWGGKWRIPTRKEISELRRNCSFKFVVLNGSKGVRVTGPNGNSIFLPISGFRVLEYDSYDYMNILGGFYWSSTPCNELSDTPENTTSYALSLIIDENGKLSSREDAECRFFGFNIRPVIDGE